MKKITALCLMLCLLLLAACSNNESTSIASSSAPDSSAASHAASTPGEEDGTESDTPVPGPNSDTASASVPVSAPQGTESLATDGASLPAFGAVPLPSADLSASLPKDKYGWESGVYLEDVPVVDDGQAYMFFEVDEYTGRWTAAFAGITFVDEFGTANSGACHYFPETHTMEYRLSINEPLWVLIGCEVDFNTGQLAYTEITPGEPNGPAPQISNQRFYDIALEFWALMEDGYAQWIAA